MGRRWHFLLRWRGVAYSYEQNGSAALKVKTKRQKRRTTWAIYPLRLRVLRKESAASGPCSLKRSVMI